MITVIVILINEKLNQLKFIYKHMVKDKSTGLPRVRIAVISRDQEGQRIDNFLLKILKGVPKTRIYRILRKGEVRVNSSRTQASYRIRQGDKIRIPPVRVAETSQHRAGDKLLSLLESRIIYEDDDILVLNKPSGVAVHGGSGVKVGVIEALRELRPRSSSLELVHRLDRETSGCLMLAKKRSILTALHTMLRSHQIDKHYLTLVRGSWSGGAREVAMPLQKSQLVAGERVVKVSEQGKEAKTLFKPEKIFSQASLMEAILYTGRTHQIRVHASFLGRPIAGDTKYGDKEFNRAMREYGLRRLFLHAHKLQFCMPISGKKVKIIAELNDDLANVLEKLSYE